MGVLDFSMVNGALPSIQHTFHLAPADLQWVMNKLLAVLYLLYGIDGQGQNTPNTVFLLNTGRW
jgi:hypothetical protein